MNWNDLSIKTKLACGFGALLIMVLMVGATGYQGIESINRGMVSISDHEVPLLKMTNEMKGSLYRSQIAIEQYRIASSAIGQVDQGELPTLMARFSKANQQYDRYSEAVLKGATMDSGLVVIPTDNQPLARAIEEADQFHNQQFQVSAQRVMRLGQEVVAMSIEEIKAMASVEREFDTITELADRAEGVIKQRVAHHKQGALGLEQLQRVMNEEIPLIDAAMEIKNAILLSRILLEEVAQQSTLSALAPLIQQYQQTIQHFDHLVKVILEGGDMDGDTIPAVADAEIRQLVVDLDENHGLFQTAAQRLIDTRTGMLERLIESQQQTKEMERGIEGVVKLITRVEQLSSDEMEHAIAAGEESHTSALNWMTAIGISALAIGTLLGMMISRSITRPLQSAVAHADQIARGDLTHIIESQSTDEVGRLMDALEAMRSKICDTMKQIAQSSDELSVASRQLAQSADEMAQSGQEQHIHTEQVATAIKEMASAIQEVERNTNQAAAAARNTADSSDAGSQIINQSVAEANALAKHISETATALQGLATESTQIGNILDVIRGIAEQTNLLALNAAIEAARAGEQGRGFAVVADEVRNLAQRTQQSTAEIQAMIERLQSGSNQAVRLMEDSQQRTANLVIQTQQAGDSFAAINGMINDIADMNIHVAASITEQTSVTDELNRSILSINDAIEANSATTEQSSVASHQLAGLADSLRSEVAKFRVH